jgi:hypothetical protein
MVLFSLHDGHHRPQHITDTTNNLSATMESFPETSDTGFPATPVTVTDTTVTVTDTTVTDTNVTHVAEYLRKVKPVEELMEKTQRMLKTASTTVDSLQLCDQIDAQIESINARIEIFASPAVHAHLLQLHALLVNLGEAFGQIEQFMVFIQIVAPSE